MKEPESMDELIYFTNRAIGEGFAKAWVYRQMCTQCGKSLMGKPRGKDGKVKIRAEEFVCPDCGYTVEKNAYEESLSCDIIYSCPHCKYSGETSVPFKRKKIEGVESVRFFCEKCKKPIDITKKMKNKKEKG